MARPVQPLGTYGRVKVTRTSTGYVARTRYRTLDGGYRRVEASEATATLATNELKAKIAAGLDSSIDGEITGRSRLRDVARLWVKEIEDQENHTEQTIERYRDSVEKVVIPAIGGLRLRELSVGKLDRFLKAEAEVAVSRARRARVVLSQVMALAVRHEALTRNPVDGTATLRRSKSEVRSLGDEELGAIRAAVAAWRDQPGLPGPRPDGQLGQVIEVMLGSSVRIGEALALRVPEDIEVAGDEVRIVISGTVVPIRGRGLVRQPYPKHSEDWRVVTLPSFSVEAITQRLETRGEFPAGTTLFCSRKGTPLWPHNVRRQWRAVREIAGSDLAEGVELSSVSPHTFRKTAATTLEAAEEGGLGLAAELLGHSSTAVTKEHYVQVRKRVDPRTARILESLAPKGDGTSDGAA